MTPIRSICPDCLTAFADAIEQLPDNRRFILNSYCDHHQVALSAVIEPGLVVSDWGMFPAATKEEAQRKVTAVTLQESMITAAVMASLEDENKIH